MSQSFGSGETPRISSAYAPLTPDGPLAPGVSDAIVSSAYRAFRPDLRAKRVLETLGIRPGLEQANRVLRRAVDRPEARAGETDAPDAVARPPLFLALYVLLKDHLASADAVYREIVQPAERSREDHTFLDPDAFGERVRLLASRFTDTSDPIGGGSEAEALALFALAYALLQPDDAASIVTPVLALGAPFQRFFGSNE